MSDGTGFSEEEVLQLTAQRLEDDLEAAYAEMVALGQNKGEPTTAEGAAARERHRQAMVALDEHRTHWRKVGEAVAQLVDRNHPGARTGVKRVDNDGSVPREGQ